MFRNARIQLTAWYLLIIMSICVFFSVIIYSMMTREFERFAHFQRVRIERQFRTPPSVFENSSQSLLSSEDKELVEMMKWRLVLYLVVINVFILVLSGGFGYILAGRTLRPIKYMLDEQRRFITDASHELRTPLTALKSMLEVSLRDKTLVLSDAKHLMKESLDEVNKLQALTDGLLDLTQYETQNNHPAFTRVYLFKILDKAWENVKHMAIKKHITRINKRKRFTVESDEQELVKLFTILFDNAIKYSPLQSKIIVQSDKHDGRVEVSVTDTGIGIASSDIDRIFDRFFRADSARAKEERNGFGLGLSIAKRIVQIHKGQITVKSIVGEGTTFTVSFPA